MIIGIPKEIKNNESRVSMTPAGVHELVKHGHTVYVQKTAGDSARTIIFEICGWHGSFDICLPRLVMRFWLSTAPSVVSSFRACATADG